MKYDEFSFFNQQLAAMLREGIPLEGALRQLCANMSRGALRSELERLEADLAAGTPLNAALAARRLPELYVRLVQVGVAGNNLPAMLVMLADHYQRVNLVWIRLKGLMVYPMIVLFAGLVLSVFISFVFLSIYGGLGLENVYYSPPPPGILINFWAAPIFIGGLFILALLALIVPGLRRDLRWRLPAFKEANLAQLAGAMSLALKHGGNLDDALNLMRQLEAGSKAGREMGQWRERLAAGRGRFAELARPGRAFPPLFIWLVANSGEDLAGGFQRAADIYSARAAHRIEMFLYAALPVSILALGGMIALQALSLVGVMSAVLRSLIAFD